MTPSLCVTRGGPGRAPSFGLDTQQPSCLPRITRTTSARGQLSPDRRRGSQVGLVPRSYSRPAQIQSSIRPSWLMSVTTTARGSERFQCWLHCSSGGSSGFLSHRGRGSVFNRTRRGAHPDGRISTQKSPLDGGQSATRRCEVPDEVNRAVTVDVERRMPLRRLGSPGPSSTGRSTATRSRSTAVQLSLSSAAPGGQLPLGPDKRLFGPERLFGQENEPPPAEHSRG